MKYRIIDTHCHPQFPQYDLDRAEVIQITLTKGIGMVCVGTDVETSRSAIELASRYEGLYASVGLHPNDELNSAYDATEYEKLAAHSKVVAIGEIGLDYYRTPSPELRRVQKERFISQLAMARRLALPVIIHCRDTLLSTGKSIDSQTQKSKDGGVYETREVGAHEDMIEILRREASGMKAVLHSFNGTVSQARTYLDEGYYIGINAIVTFSEQYNEMVKSIPGDRILLETDAPYLAPTPHRGKRNEPHYIEAVGNHIAAVRGISPDELFRITTASARNLFAKLD